MSTAFRPIPLKSAEHRPTGLSYCAGIEKRARVAFYGLDAGGQLNAGIGFEAVAEFDTYDAAAAAMRAAAELWLGFVNDREGLTQ